MRESNVNSRTFDNPHQFKGSDDILRHMSQNKPLDDNRRGRTPTGPPAKFSFLSGIHPDLDEALCEIQSPNSFSTRSGHRRRSNNEGMFFDETRKGKRNNDHERNFNDDKSKENRIGDTFGVKGIDMKLEASASSSNNSLLLSRAVMDSSKPKEITCAKVLDESIDSLPFSVDGMERAKRKIQSQAAKIRYLEARLEKAASSCSSKCDADDENEVKKKIMSPEERLEAHIERKRQENKYKEVVGKWEAPPPIQHENLIAKVKRKDNLVDRLVTDPKQRRVHNEINKKVKKIQKKYENSVSDDEQGDEKYRDFSHYTRTSGQVKQHSKKSRKSKKTVNNMPQNLMTRLNMSVKERRAFKNQEEHTPDELRRTLRGHKMQSKSWRMSQEFNADNFSNSDDSNHDSFHSANCRIQCETCSSATGCEEDVDNPGIYYCQRCWEEYEYSEVKIDGSKSTVGRHMNSGTREQSPGKKSRHQRHKKYDEALWIIHDNPKLAGRLNWSGSKKMDCLVETKDSSRKNCVKILLGTIEYCGPVSESGLKGQTEQGSIKNTDRGAECIRISNIVGFTINHDNVETRLTKNKTVYEFRLDQKDAIKLTGISAEMQLQDFFHGCKGAVDVILAPQCSSGGWYPIREATSSRKIAPQFRSNGLGYIRLGDDMGNNGLAFLSCDSCNTFFLSEVDVDRGDSYNEIPSSKGNSMSTGTMVRKPNRVEKKQSAKNVVLDESDCDSLIDFSCDEVDSENSVNAGILLKELLNIEVSKDVKWNEKAELLESLGKAIGKPNGRASCSNALTYIQDVISAKNVNVNVLRNALFVIEKIGDSMKQELVYHISWKTIMIEMLKLLKNKQVGNRTNDVLKKLHGKCFTLSNSMVAVSHVLGMGKANTELRKSMGSFKQAPLEDMSQSMQKSNCVEVIKWIALTVEAERVMEDIHPIMDENGLSQLANIFMSHESHRDANCRKNSLDGLLHTVLYGTRKLNMEKIEALKLCIDMKSKNPRSWARLTKSVSHALKVEAAL